MRGSIRWYDKTADDGILRDMKGNDYYFNSWSFSETYWLATGISKKTGKKVTLNVGRLFPGLWTERKEVRDKRCDDLKTNMPVIFRQAKGIDRPWAVDIEIMPVSKALKEWLGLR
jgi:hypothetical protein